MDAAAEEISLRSLARTALDKCDGDRHKALPKLVKDIKAQKQFYGQIVDRLVERACLEELSRVVRCDRKTLWSEGQPASDAGERIAIMARSNLLNFVLPNGKRLAHASPADCMASSEDYLKQGKTMCHMGRWLWLIAQNVPEGKSVGKMLSEERLSELRAEAEKNGQE